MLHLISASPVEPAVLERIDAGCSIVFMDNAVLQLMRGGRLSARLTQLAASNRLCALSADLQIRGIDAGQIVEGIEVIDYHGLVELAVAHPIIQSWH